MGCQTRRGARGIGAAASALLAAASAVAAAPPPELAFTHLETGTPGEAVAALALEPSAGSLAIGDARGVGLVGPDGRGQRVLKRGPVRDLLFQGGAGGALWAGTAAGLYRIDAGGRVASVAAAPGSEARDVQRLAWTEGALGLAGGAGAFVSSDGERWRHPSPQLPRAPARAIALRRREDGVDCLTVLESRLFEMSLTPGPDGLEARRVERMALPAGREAGGPVDVVFDLAGADAVAVLPGAFAVRDRRGGSWRSVRPALPPGASAQRLVAAQGRLWLATDRGLLSADTLEGPWRRAPGPAGSASIGALLGDASGLYVGAGDRVWVGRPARGPADAAARLRTPEGDPPIEQVQRAALAYLELGSSRISGLRRGVSLRGWLPVVALRVSRNRDEDRDTDFDQAIVSGDLRETVDRGHGRARDTEASLSFAWDLGEVLYHPEAIDVSREAREVIKLRDDVLDEVNQLYFERRRVLAELAALPDRSADEALRLRLRAAELAAGLDAWTGGWWSRARAGAP